MTPAWSSWYLGTSPGTSRERIERERIDGCPARIRTWVKGSKGLCAATTPPGRVGRRRPCAAVPCGKSLYHARASSMYPVPRPVCDRAVAGGGLWYNALVVHSLSTRYSATGERLHPLGRLDNGQASHPYRIHPDGRGSRCAGAGRRVFRKRRGIPAACREYRRDADGRGADARSNSHSRADSHSRRADRDSGADSHSQARADRFRSPS